jgi:hypothetical protein
MAFLPLLTRHEQHEATRATAETACCSFPADASNPLLKTFIRNKHALWQESVIFAKENVISYDEERNAALDR